MLADEMLSKIVRSAILSARVKRPDIHANSLFLIAPVENGKTSLALENCGEKPLILSDLSGIGLLEALFQEKSVTHVVINDLAAVSGHKSSVSKLTISVLNGLAEEGCYKIALPRMGHLSLEGRKVGVIACCTPDLVDDNRTWWKRSGFASRVLPVRFEHSVSLQMKILQGIAHFSEKDIHKQKGALQVPESYCNVAIPEKEAQQLLLLSQQIAKDKHEIGYRRAKQIRALACGHALLRGWKNARVGKQDIEFLSEALDFFMEGKEI